MIKVRIDQIDQDGIVYRSFEFSRHAREIDAFIDRIRRAYNMDRTKVYADGRLIAGPDENDQSEADHYRSSAEDRGK